MQTVVHARCKVLSVPRGMNQSARDGRAWRCVGCAVRGVRAKLGVPAGGCPRAAGDAAVSYPAGWPNVV
eukprot:359260-Chlamydomonas_euryale.AAC.2